MNIAVVGTGYVGLVTGTVFADMGNNVVCVDADQAKVDRLIEGIMPIYETGLEDMVRKNLEAGRLSFTTDLGYGVRSAGIIFIAVGTPSGPDGEPDLTQVTEAARDIARHMDSYKVIVNKSTVPIGTGDLVREIIEQNKVHDVGFDVVSNPEFLREGSAIHETLNPDRVIIGAPSREAAAPLLELYAPLECPMFVTDVISAEIIKYASNSFLALKISFINAISRVCEEAGGDVTQVAKGMGYDKRIGAQFLQAGLGFGGSCFGKDVKALIHSCNALDCDTGILQSILDINDTQPIRFASRVKRALGSLKGEKIAVLGLAFKPNTDDMRDAKSIDVISALLSEGAVVRAYDPIATENCRRILPRITYCADPYEAATGASALLLVTEWDEFQSLDFAKLKDTMARPVLFDGRNLYDPERMRRLGFEYYCIGRACKSSSTAVES